MVASKHGKTSPGRQDETTPLLGSGSLHDTPGSVTAFPSLPPPPYPNGEEEIGEYQDPSLVDFDDQLKPKLVLAEVRALIPFSWPVSAGFILQNSIYMAAIFSLGRSSTQALAAMALCALFCNVTGYSLGIGMASALDTLCSQAYGESLKGSVPKIELGRHLQRGIVVMLVMTIPIITLWCFTEPLLLLTGQEPDVAHLSATFVLCMIPGLIPYFIAESIKRFLQSQGIMSAAMMVVIIVSPVNLVLQYLLVWSPWAIGVIGAPLAIAASYWVLCIFMIAYVKYVAGGDAWGGFEAKEAFDLRKIWGFIKLGTPGIAMTASEWWAFEVVALASGLLGESYLAAQTIVLNTCSLTYMIPLGFGIAATTRIGNSLGAGCPNRARTSAYAALGLGLLLALFNSTLLLIIKDQWGYLWTTDPSVVKIVAEVLPLASVFQLSDAVGAVSGGILRGIGRQDLGAYLNIFAYYFLGLPVGLWACFQQKLGLLGLWMGLSVGLITVSLVQIFIIYRTDWKLEARNAHERISSRVISQGVEEGVIPVQDDTVHQ
ncbi:hypothetical protein HDU67_008002 [Dinochytrium kinnereticum]|nr:hypothetical protein HDU67_008002 [Dinochytrium kinnereticum]